MSDQQGNAGDVLLPVSRSLGYFRPNPGNAFPESLYFFNALRIEKWLKLKNELLKSSLLT